MAALSKTIGARLRQARDLCGYSQMKAAELLGYSNSSRLAKIEGGLGINVCQDLEDLGCVVNRVNWGNPCFRNINKIRYLNLRAQAMHHAARAAKEGRLSIRTLEHQRAMIDQSSRIPKTFNEKARIRVPPKHSAEWEGLKSPDLWDTVCFLFLETAEYIVADDHPSTGKGGAGEAQTDLTEIAAGLFAGVDAGE